MIKNRRVQMGLTKVEIDLGVGARALSKWNLLHNVLMEGKRELRRMGNQVDARVIYLWQKTPRYLIVEAPHWTLELDGHEWQALSRALRHSGTDGRSLLAWFNSYQRMDKTFAK